jgi:hypothetical protein
MIKYQDKDVFELMLTVKVNRKLAKKHVNGSEGMVIGMSCQTLVCALAIIVLWLESYT